MKKHFRGQFMRGQRLYYEGRTEGSVMKQAKGNKLIQQFYRGFWSNNAQDIFAEAYGDK